jgi:hypothetical protein
MLLQRLQLYMGTGLALSFNELLKMLATVAELMLLPRPGSPLLAACPLTNTASPAGEGEPLALCLDPSVLEAPPVLVALSVLARVVVREAAAALASAAAAAAAAATAEALTVGLV